MSAGSKIVPVRIPDEMLAAMHEQILRLTQRSFEFPPNVSDFIRAAINEKLAHMERSRQPRRRKAKEPTYVG